MHISYNSRTSNDELQHILARLERTGNDGAVKSVLLQAYNIDLIAALQTNTTVSKLKLDINWIFRDGMMMGNNATTLINHLSTSIALKEIDIFLWLQEYDPDPQSRILVAIGRNPHITKVKLELYGPPHGLASMLRSTPSMHDLEVKFDKHFDTPQEANELAAAFVANQTLHTLDLKGCAALVRQILESMELSRSQRDGDAVDHALTSISATFDGPITGESLCTPGLERVLSSTSTMPMRRLTIRRCTFSSAVSSAPLWSGLQSNTSLEHVEFAGCTFGDGVSDRLVQSLRARLSIERIALLHCLFGNNTAGSVVVDLLRQSTSSNMTIDSHLESYLDFWQELTRVPSMTHLRPQLCLTIPNLAELERMCESLPAVFNLRKLQLNSDTRLSRPTDEQRERFMSALKANVSLIRLEATDRLFPTPKSQQVKQALLDRNLNLPHLLGTAHPKEHVNDALPVPIVPVRAEANLHPALLCSALPAQRFVLTHLMRKLVAKSVEETNRLALEGQVLANQLIAVNPNPIPQALQIHNRDADAGDALMEDRSGVDVGSRSSEAMMVLASREEIREVILRTGAIGIARTETTYILDVRFGEELPNGIFTGGGHGTGPSWRWVHGSILLLPEMHPSIAMLLMPNVHAPVVVYCSSGERAAAVQEYLFRLGYVHVLNAGGLDNLNAAMS